MHRTITITAEPPPTLSLPEQRALLCQALGQRASPDVRIKLAQLHNLLDEFDEAIALLCGEGVPCNFATAHARALAHLGRRLNGDAEAAVVAAREAEKMAEGAHARADCLVLLARALMLCGRQDEAQDAVGVALSLAPMNGSALRMMCTPWFDAKMPEKVLACCDAVGAQGVAHVQLLGLQTMALAQLGRTEEARKLAGFDRFLWETMPPVPAGWDDLPAFHAALAQELLQSPGLRNGRSGTASIATLRVDEPARAAAPATRALQQMICDQLHARIEALGAADHPWLHQRPAKAMLRMWCVMTGSDGFERWHMHPAGWASGGYYVSVPDSVARGNSTAGCLVFGVPERFVGQPAAEAFGTRLMRPRAGLLSLFPSHAYHRTHPHGAEGLRICVAFDLIPV